MADTATETSPLLHAPSASGLSTETRARPPRTVTFSPNITTRTIDSGPRPQTAVQHGAGTSTGLSAAAAAAATGNGTGGGPPMLSALNSRLRRRNSHGAAFAALPPSLPAAAAKIGPQRSSKNAQKLKLLPNPEDVGDEGPDEEGGRDVYSQYTRIKDPTARRDAARLGKADRDRLPRVTAYCTANKYQMEGLMRFLKGKTKARGASPKLIDECIYTPYSYSSRQVQHQHQQSGGMDGGQQQYEEVHPRPAGIWERRHSTGEVMEDGAGQEDMAQAGHEEQQQQHQHQHQHQGGSGGSSSGGNGGDVGIDFSLDGLSSSSACHDVLEHEMGVPEGAVSAPDRLVDFDIQVHTPELFLFDYGVVVIWGMSVAQEQRFLKEISKFELEKLAPDDIETEYFNFYYTREYQARIYNDFITLRDKNNYMTKLAISHALAQSVKTSLFEELIASTIDTCKDIPTQIALTGTIALSRAQINMQIGELFILRINIHLNGSVLDTPELFWVEPQLEPVYQAVRSYLEMDQRVGLLTERLDVIADLLAVLKDQLSHGHGEKLEWIVIVLIAMEILVAGINIVVDLYAGVD